MSKKGNAQEETVRSYKGFTHGMTSIYNFQYEEGKSYETERAEVRASGFHASPYPPSCFPTYPPGYSVYHLVQQSGEFSSDDEMTASTKISIGKKMDGNGLACAAVDYTMENIKESMPPHDPETKDFVGTSAIGARKVSCTGGDRSLSSSIDGMASAAVAMGHCSCSSLEGRNGVAAAVGQYGTSYARGPRNISAATNLYGISATKGQHARGAQRRRDCRSRRSVDVGKGASCRIRQYRAGRALMRHGKELGGGIDRGIGHGVSRWGV